MQSEMLRLSRWLQLFTKFLLFGFLEIKFETRLDLITRTCEVYLGFSFVKKIYAGCGKIIDDI